MVRYLLRANVVDVRVQTTSRQDESFTSNAFGGHSDDHAWRNIHHIGISCLADA